MNIQGFDPYDFSKKEITGVPVYYKNLPWAPCVHIRFQFSTGAFADPVGKEGLAHFLEHIIGNGSPSLPNRKAIREFSRIYMLNSRNAFTSHYWTSYVGRCLPEHFKTVMEKMAEYVSQPLIKPEDVEHERKVITQETWQRYRNNKFLAYTKEVSNIVHPHHQRNRIASPLGWPDSILTITQDDLRAFHKRNYVKENLTIFLVGAVEPTHIECLEEILKDLPSGERTMVDFGTVEKPLQPRLEKSGEEIGYPREQVHFSLERIVAKEENFNEEVADQARVLLRDALFERLRTENSLCYGVSVNWRTYQDRFDVEVEVETSMEKLPLAEREIRNVIDEIVAGKWRERFTIIHKTAIDQIKSEERLSEKVITSASAEFDRVGRITPLSTSLENADKVSYEDVADLLRRVFDKEYTFESAILPTIS